MGGSTCWWPSAIRFTIFFCIRSSLCLCVSVVTTMVGFVVFAQRDVSDADLDAASAGRVVRIGIVTNENRM